MQLGTRWRKPGRCIKATEKMWTIKSACLRVVVTLLLTFGFVPHLLIALFRAATQKVDEAERDD